MATKNPKLFGAFLNGIFKGIYEKDPDITVDFLKEHIFKDNQDVTVEDLRTLYENCSNVIQKAALHDWELLDLESYLKQSNFSDEQQEVFLKFWRTQKNKIHDIIIKDTTWNNTLQKMSWRIDSKTKSKKVAEMNELTAIVEMVVGNNQQKDKNQNNTQVIQFEMDRDQLAKVIGEINTIQKQLNKIGNQ